MIYLTITVILSYIWFNHGSIVELRIFDPWSFHQRSQSRKNFEEQISSIFLYF